MPTIIGSRAKRAEAPEEPVAAYCLHDQWPEVFELPHLDAIAVQCPQCGAMLATVSRQVLAQGNYYEIDIGLNRTLVFGTRNSVTGFDHANRVAMSYKVNRDRSWDI